MTELIEVAPPQKRQSKLGLSQWAVMLMITMITPLLVISQGINFVLPKTMFFLAGMLVFLALALFMRGGRPFWKIPLFKPTTVLAGLMLLSALLSIAPVMSWAGTYQRFQGAVVALLAMIWALALARWLAVERRQWWMMTAVSLAGTLVSFTPFLESWRYDKEPFRWRPGGSLGNPIFLGAYLIMAMPFTLAGLVRTRGWRRAGYGAALALQLLAFVTTQSRGPAVGLAAGLAVFAGLLLWPRYRFKLLLGLALLPLLGGLAWGALKSGLVPTERVSEIGFVRRVAGEAGGARSVRVRLVLWQAAADLIQEWPVMGLAGDRWSGIRPFIGYGVDTAAVVYTAVYPPELAHIEDPDALWDRAHNEILDIVVMRGWLGLLAYLALATAVIRQGWQAWRRAETAAARALIAAPMAALAAHVAEVQFAFTVTTTMMMAWLCVGLVGSFAEVGVDHGDMEGTERGEHGVVWQWVKGGLAFLLVLTAVRVAGGAFMANVWVADGRQLDRAGKWQASIETYDRVIALVPWQGTYHQFRGEAFYNLGRILPPEQADLQGELLAAAERSLARARALEPLEMEHYTNSGVLHAFWSEIDPPHLETAVQFYEQAFRLAPTRVELRRDLGHVYHNHGRYAEALSQYEIGIAVDPENTLLYQDAALAAAAMGDEALAAWYRDKAGLSAGFDGS